MTASETNAAGLTGSSSLTFTYDTVAPAAPVITADAVNGNNSVALSGTAGPNTTVTVYDAQTVRGTTTTNASGTWNFTTGTLPSGSQTLTATATDAAGNTSAASNAIDPTIASASAPTVTAKSITVTGNAQTISTLTAGETAVVTLGLSSAVTVSGGVPTLTLNDGGTAIYDASLSTATALAFDYTVAAGESANALAVTGVNLNGAAVADAFGNAANLSGADTTFSPISVKTTATLQTTSATSVANETATWTYSASGALQEVVYTGIAGQEYTTTDLVYGANNTPASEVWSNGSTVVQTETWNANGTVNNVHYYGFTGAYTDYDVSYGANNKPVLATYSNGMTETWTYNSDNTLAETITQGITGQKYTTTDLVYGANNTPASEVWSNGSTVVQTETWNANGTVNNVHYYGFTGAYTDYDVSYGANNKPVLATYSNGMTETWTYNSDNTLAETITQGITGQKYTTTDLVYGANNTPASEVWSNGSTVVQTETWNANGTVNNVHYYGFTGAYTDYDVSYGANNKPVLATYSNGMTETWTYNSDNTLAETITQGITGQKYTTTDLVYGANNTPASEVWSNGSTVVQTETWNANGTVNNVHYYGFTGAYTDYDVSYGANNKPVLATYSNGMTETWTYNSDNTLNEVVVTGCHRPDVHFHGYAVWHQQCPGQRGVEQRFNGHPDRDLECQRHYQQRRLFRHHQSALHQLRCRLWRQQQAGAAPPTPTA